MAPYDDDDKPSWRDIDKQRDRSSYQGSGKRDSRDSEILKSDYRKQQYMKKASKLFGGKKKSVAHDTAAKSLETAKGTKKFAAEANKYIDEFGLPEKWDVLMLLLEHPDVDQFENITEKLVDIFESGSVAEQRVAVSTLRIVSMTAKDPDIADIAKETLERIES